MAAFGRYTLAAAAQTGNNTHTGVALVEPASRVMVEFQVSAVGGTPTVTFAVQGSFDNVNWDTTGVAMIPSNTDTPAATRAVVAVGTYHQAVSQRQSRSHPFYRVVTTANTNVTYGPVYLWYDEDDNS